MSDYNGWKNRETWCANLYLDNDRGAYFETQRALARGLIRAADFANEFPEVTLHVYRHVAIEIEDMVREWRDDSVEFSDATALEMFMDIGSFWRVDFDEIAKAKLDVFPVELLQPKNASDLIENERPLGHTVARCPDCDLGVILWDEGECAGYESGQCDTCVISDCKSPDSGPWHFCDWQPVAVDVLGLEFDHV